MIDLAALDPQSLGFPQCGTCPYVQAGTAAICFACASATIQAVPEERCSVCSQRLNAWGRCSNSICHNPQRKFRSIHAIAMHTTTLRDVLARYKYQDKRGWGAIFGRVIAGYVDEYSTNFLDFDLIIGNPAYTGAGATRNWDHVGLMLSHAATESVYDWPFHTHTGTPIAKVRATTSLAGKTLAERHRIAEEEIQPALVVTDPDLISDARILVVDDVFTDGSTLQAVAAVLKGAGARDVSGLVLARQPWQG